MNILGISAFYHDSAASIIVDGEIIVAAQEERFNRIKHYAGFPIHAIRFCLNYLGITIDELDAVTFYDKPFLKFERLLETYYNFSPKGHRSFVSAIPIWLKEKLFLKKIIREGLCEIMKYDKKKLTLLFPEHHLSHAASAFYPSRFERSAILTMDGVGEWATASICLGEGKDISILKELHFPHSLGLLYSGFTYYLGFKVNSDEYKLMGLAPYGDSSSSQVHHFIDQIKKNIVEIKSDGSIWLNQDYFSYATGLSMVKENLWENLFGFPLRKPNSDLKQVHCNLAYAIQHITEEIILSLAKEAKKLTHSENLCMAGGVALNCVANGKLLNIGLFKELFIQPSAGDAGGALGSALAGYYIYFGMERNVTQFQDAMKGALLGPDILESDIKNLIHQNNVPSIYFEDFNTLCDKVSEWIAEGNIVGWVQGRMEFGPRALGNRSILADATNPDMKKKLNLKIKFRESFRPFAASVLNEDGIHYFEHTGNSPYMLLAQPIQKKIRKKTPDNFNTLSIQEKLNCLYSEIPAVTHVNYSSRIQTVHKETNLKFWQLLTSYKNLTGHSLLVNTSFNIQDEPIVCTPEEAYQCFIKTEMDFLVIGNFIIKKK